MDEYAVLVDGVVRDALGLDGARGAGDAPAEALTAPALRTFPWWPAGECDGCCSHDRTERCDCEGGSEAGPSPCGE